MENLLTIEQVSEITKLQVRTIHKMKFKKQLPYVKLGGALRFRESDIENWINSNLKNKEEETTKKNQPLKGLAKTAEICSIA